jgi:hypothetical protein
MINDTNYNVNDLDRVLTFGLGFASVGFQFFYLLSAWDNKCCPQCRETSYVPRWDDKSLHFGQHLYIVLKKSSWHQNHWKSSSDYEFDTFKLLFFIQVTFVFLTLVTSLPSSATFIFVDFGRILVVHPHCDSVYTILWQFLHSALVICGRISLSWKGFLMANCRTIWQNIDLEIKKN